MVNELRLAPLHEKEWDPEVRGLFQKMGYEKDTDLYNVLKTLARHPKLLKRWLPFANHVLFKSSLSPRVREIVILRVGWLCRSEYEWTQHVQIAAEEAGMTEADFAAIEVGSADRLWTGGERVALRLAEELFASKTVQEETWSELTQNFNEHQVMDLVATIGNYTMVSMMLNAFGVPLDDWLERYKEF